MSDWTNSPHELDWDDEITSDSGSFLLLEEGDYNFTVTAFERGRWKGSEKIPPCNMATLTLSVETSGGTAQVKYDLQLYSTMEWKISAFFRSIGQKKHGEPLRPRWNEVVGAKGRARFYTRTYTKRNGGGEGQANDVDRFYDYDPAFFVEANPSASWAAGKF